MNHATRFWLAVKFYRLHSNDFESNSTMKVNFSKAHICNLIGIRRNVIDQFVSTLKETDFVQNLMKINKYLSPVELEPRKYEQVFKQYAVNYADLKIGGIFSLQY